MDPLIAILKTLKDYDVDFVTIGNLGAGQFATLTCGLTPQSDPLPCF